MAVANTTVLELLGKVVSFEHVLEVPLTEHLSITSRKKICGTVAAVVFTLNSEPEIAVDDGEFYPLSELVDFSVNPFK